MLRTSRAHGMQGWAIPELVPQYVGNFHVNIYFMTPGLLDLELLSVDTILTAPTTFEMQPPSPPFAPKNRKQHPGQHDLPMWVSLLWLARAAAKHSGGIIGKRVKTPPYMELPVKFQGLAFSRVLREACRVGVVSLGCPWCAIGNGCRELCGP